MTTAGSEQYLVEMSDRRANWLVLDSDLDKFELSNAPSPTPSMGACALSLLCSTGEIPIYMDTGLDSFVFDIPSSVSLEMQDPLFSMSVDGGEATVPVEPQLLFHPQPSEVSRHWSHGAAQSGERSMEYQLTVSAHPDLSSVDEDFRSVSPSVSAWASPATSSMTSPTRSTTASPYGSPRLSFPRSPKFLCSGTHYRHHTVITNENVRDSSNASLRPYYRSPTSSLSLALFGSGSLSPSSSILTADAERLPRNRSFSKRLQKSRSCSPLAEGSRRTLDLKEPISAPVTPVRQVFEIPLTSTDSSRTMGSISSTGSPQSFIVSSPLASPSSKTRNLPGILDWLHDIELELWIHQKGSRTIRPKFRLAGYTSEASNNRDTQLVNTLTYGTADFIPAEQHPFVVRRENVDSPPILRRLTVAGDKTKDYISRKASLTVSSNGTYAVGGTELFPFPSSGSTSATQPRCEPLKLQWRFEYLVGDYLAEGQPASGEKTVTPLRFSCSPGMLHPTHKKKMRLMRTMKRNLSAMLSAQKMHVQRPSLRPDLANDQRDKCGDALRPPAALPHLQSAVPGDIYYSAFEDFAFEANSIRASMAASRHAF